MIRLEAPELIEGNENFFIDACADINIVKFEALKGDVVVNTGDHVKIFGITENFLHTIGTVKLHFTEIPNIFHVVRSFPVKCKGIIGKPFLRKEKAEISFNYNTLVTQSEPTRLKPFLGLGREDEEYKIFSSTAHSSVKFPEPESRIFRVRARMREPIPIPIINPALEEKYLPRIDTINGLGETLVSQTNGICHVMAVNTLSEDVDIEVTPQELFPFEYFYASFKINQENSSSSSEDEEPPKDRVEAIMKALRLNDLTNVERDRVRKLVEEFPDRYRLPGDRLPCTNRVHHKIPTIDEIPINTRQYTFPIVHKIEIERQISKKLYDEVIVPSQSPYNSPVWIVPKNPIRKGDRECEW